MTAWVLEFARSPVPGRVKSRLARTEGAREAARLYRLLAEDVHRVLLPLQASGEMRLVLCADDGPSPGAVGRWLVGAAETWPQGVGDLGARMARCASRAFAAGAERVLLVGTDLVGLRPDAVRGAAAALRGAAAALAPTPDGGYGLLGLRREALGLLRDVPWGTDQVAAVTRRRAREGRLSLVELPPVRDVDVEGDLEGAVPLLSVLVPARDEEGRLGALLDDLIAQGRPHGGEVEILVSDGASTDATVAVARRRAVRVLEGGPGRGTQLARAAAVARGRWLWTVHADVRLAPGTLDRVVAFARRRPRPWAWLDMRIDDPHRYHRATEAIARLRARLLCLPYGDQGILVRRAVFDRVGGYARVPLMEDVILARGLARYGPPAALGPGLLVDARRWRRVGLLRTSVHNLLNLLGFLLLGRDPARLAARYERG